MSLSNQDLQQYVGQSLADAQSDLESQGYIVDTVKLGRFATGCVLPKPIRAGENSSQKRAIISYNGDDPQHTVVSIRQD